VPYAEYCFITLFGKPTLLKNWIGQKYGHIIKFSITTRHVLILSKITTILKLCENSELDVRRYNKSPESPYLGALGTIFAHVQKLA
jgi:hypothetical protein